MKLAIYIELSGTEYLVGYLDGEGISDTCFAYDEKYMNSEMAVPVSVSLPFKEGRFTPEQTRNFFEGLLPEGLTRRTVAHFIHADEGDYIKILAVLGKECLGALRVAEPEEMDEETEWYEAISIQEMEKLAREGATKSAELVTKSHLSLTGASGKVGMYLDETTGRWYLPKGTAPSTHIVKQSHVRLDGIVVNEQITLCTAKLLGIDVADSFVINIGNHLDEDVLFASKRYDRKFVESGRMIAGMPRPVRLHQEDFAQALGIASANKYESDSGNYMRKAFELVRNVSVKPVEDQVKLWEIIVFDFLIGNTDAHLKNFSLVYGADGSGIRLSPAYDMISTTIYEQSTRNMAFRIGNVHSIEKMNRNTFLDAVKEIGIGQKMAMQSFERLSADFENALREACYMLKEQGFSQPDTMREKILKTGGYRNIS